MRKGIALILVSIILVLALVAGACAQPASAPKPAPAPAPAPKPAPASISAAEFYANNTIIISVPSSAGGGTDFSGRLLAAYWPEFVGGHAVVKNKPGGGGLEGTNYVINAKPDGLTIGTSEFSSDVAGPWLFKEPGVKYDLADINYIGQMGRSLMVVSIGVEAPVDDLKGLQQMTGFKFGSRGPRGNLAVSAALAAYFLGLKDANVVTGYGGTSEIILAMKRGEVDGYVNSAASTAADMPKEAIKTVVVVLAPERAAEFPDVLAIGEIVTMTREQEKMLDILQVFSSSKVLFTAPGVPADRVEFLREKFIEILSSNGYLRQAKLRWPVWTDPVPGDELTKKIKDLTELSPQDLSRFEEILNTYIK